MGGYEGVQGVMREEYNRDLTNLDLGDGLGGELGGRLLHKLEGTGKFSFRMRDKNIYDTF